MEGNGDIDYRKRGISPGIHGLQNLGNTCFFNSVIQAMTHTTLLQEHFSKPGKSVCGVILSLDATLRPVLNEKIREEKQEKEGKRKRIIGRDENVNHIARDLEDHLTVGANEGGIQHRNENENENGNENGNENENENGNENENENGNENGNEMEGLGSLLEGPLTQSLMELFKNMWDRSSKTLNPGQVLGEIRKKAARFRGGHQQDSQELLRYLVDGMRSEEQRVIIFYYYYFLFYYFC
jgi:uncharacterized UBP type Zn finger protein